MVIPFTSAHSRKTRMSIIVEEGERRLRNGVRGLDSVERNRAVMVLEAEKERTSGNHET